MNDLEQELARFEAAMREQLGWNDHDLARMPDGGEYTRHVTAGAWTGWISHVRAKHQGPKERQADALTRMLPIFEKLLKDVVFTSDRGGQVIADMQMLRASEPHPEDIAGNLAYREHEAVETLIAEGWVWDGDQWVLPSSGDGRAAALLEPVGEGWQPIETAPQGREMFVVKAFNVRNGFTGGKPYTSDPWCVWQDEPGKFARWPHNFAPTHWHALAASPKSNGGMGS